MSNRFAAFLASAFIGTTIVLFVGCHQAYAKAPKCSIVYINGDAVIRCPVVIKVPK